MKKYRFLLIAFGFSLVFASCGESLEDKAERDAKEFTQKYCPTPVVNFERTDSMTFDKATKTCVYWRTLSGQADREAVIKANEPKLKGVIKQSLVNNPGLKKHKEAGFNFRYVYRSMKTKKILLDITFTKKDY